MKIIDLYIARTILIGTVLALGVLASLDMFFAIVDELIDVGKGSFGYRDALMALVMTTPARLYNLFPAAVLVGSLMSLGTLASQSELVAMRAAGISMRRIVRASTRAGLLLMVIVVLLGEFLVPPAQRQAQALDSKKQGLKVSAGKDAIWLRDGQRFISIGRLYPGLRLEDVSIHVFDDDNQLLSATSAKAAFYHDSQWELHDIRRSIFSSSGVIAEQREVERQSRLVEPQLLGVLTVEPRMMSAFELHRYIRYLVNNKLESSGFELAFWLKMTTPLSCIVMLFIVLPFVFGSLRSVNTGQLLVVGILLGLSFYILIQIASRAGQIYGVPPFISATFPVLCFTVAGLLGLTKIR